MKYEDFYPISDSVALLVCGEYYTCMNEIRQVNYTLESGGSIKFTEGTVIKNGKNLRLGNYYNGELIFSEGYEPVGIQPYKFDKGLLYQTRGKIYLNDEVLFTVWDNYEVLGRPTYANGWVYFETRKSPAPFGWEVWKYNIETKEKVKLLDHGANPYVYEDKLFYSSWENGEFVTRWKFNSM